jgi:arginase family enzyme
VVLYDSLGSEVANSVSAGGPTTVVAGDCLAWLGTLAGAQRAGLDPSVVWFDAHGDLHTVASSTSGYLGGMALRMGLGADRGLLGAPLGLRPIPGSRAILVDARDLDPAESDYLATSEVTHTSVAAIGPDDLPDRPVILHIDLDVIDPPRCRVCDSPQMADRAPQPRSTP